MEDDNNKKTLNKWLKGESNIGDYYISWTLFNRPILNIIDGDDICVVIVEPFDRIYKDDDVNSIKKWGIDNCKSIENAVVEYD